MSMRFPLMIVLLLIAALTPAPAGLATERFQASQPHMGTTFKFVFYAADQAAAQQALRAVDQRVEQLEQSMSDYRSDSEINRLAATAGNGQAVRVSAHLFKVLQQADTISRRTDGAFDVTVGPLTKLWRRARRQKQMPPAPLLERALQAVGYQHLLLETPQSTVTLNRPEMRIDLGGIAKGYAADEAVKVFAEHGIDRCLVDAGGDLTLASPPPDHEGWRIGIAPLEPGGPPTQTLTLAHCGIATSGDAWQFVELQGKRYSHTIDPHLGIATTRRHSVTVIAPDCTTADGYASALCVLDPRQGMAVVEKLPAVEALVVVGTNDGDVTTVRSSGFPLTAAMNDRARTRDGAYKLNDEGLMPDD